MKRTALVIALSVFAAGSAFAQSSGSDAMQACLTKSVGSDGKPLAGAAKASALKKCCESAAVTKDGKPLMGAAKASFVKKCTG